MRLAGQSKLLDKSQLGTPAAWVDCSFVVCRDYNSFRKDLHNLLGLGRGRAQQTRRVVCPVVIGFAHPCSFSAQGNATCFQHHRWKIRYPNIARQSSDGTFLQLVRGPQRHPALATRRTTYLKVEDETCSQGNQYPENSWDSWVYFGYTIHILFPYNGNDF